MVFAYMMAFALLESLFVTGIMVLLSLLVPAGWLRHGFAYKGFVILLIATIDALLLQRSLDHDFPSIPTLVLLSLPALALVAALIGVLQSRPNLQNLLARIQDRFLVMLFVYIPIGVLSLIAVTFRNLF